MPLRSNGNNESVRRTLERLDDFCTTELTAGETTNDVGYRITVTVDSVSSFDNSYRLPKEEIPPEPPKDADSDKDGIWDCYDINPDKRDNYDELYVELINKNVILMDDILTTNDGFSVIKVPLSDILEKYDIKQIRLTKDEYYSSSDLQDWYIFSVRSSGGRWKNSILKMRCYEKGKRGMGIAIPFIYFSDNLVFNYLKDLDKYEKELYSQIEIITEGKSDVYSYSEELAQYFANPNSAANYLIAELYVEKVMEKDCDVNGNIDIPVANKRITKFLKTLTSIYDEEGNTVKIKDKNALTIQEKQAILSVRTGNTSFNSFAAEVVFHAEYAILSADLIKSYDALEQNPVVMIEPNYSLIAAIENEFIFKSAVKADMVLEKRKRVE